MKGRNRSHRRKAKRVLLWAGAVFLLVQFLGTLLVDHLWPEVRFPSAADTVTKLRTQERSPDILCLGSSRSGAAFRAGEVQTLTRLWSEDHSVEVFNASLPAGDLVTADYLMEQLLAAGVRPAVVVIEVSPETLARRNEWLGLHARRQFTWSDVPRFFQDTIYSGHGMRLLSARLVPLYVYRRQIWHKLYELVEQLDEDPYSDCLFAGPLAPVPEHVLAADPAERSGVSWEHFMEKSRARMVGDPAARTQLGLGAIRRWLRGYQVGGTAADSLERLIQRCRQREIEVVLVGVPLAAAHRELYTTEIEDQFQAYMRRVATTYRCCFLDYRSRLPDELFQDHHHLLHEGGLLFSRLLVQEALVPLWRGIKRAK